MKPDNVSSVFLVSANSIDTSSFLIQCANDFSGKGLKVLYISSTPFDNLPPGIHGMPSLSSETLSQIKFLYLPRYQDLYKLLFSLDLYADVPRVIIVERLDQFCHLPELELTEKYDLEVHCARLCAALLDAASVSARFNKKEAVVVTSFEYNKGQENIVSMLANTFFNSFLWLVEKLPSQDSKGRDRISMKEIGCPSSLKQTQVEFVLSSDKVLILEKIIHFAGIKA